MEFCFDEKGAYRTALDGKAGTGQTSEELEARFVADDARADWSSIRSTRVKITKEGMVVVPAGEAPAEKGGQAPELNRFSRLSDLGKDDEEALAGQLSKRESEKRNVDQFVEHMRENEVKGHD